MFNIKEDTRRTGSNDNPLTTSLLHPQSTYMCLSEVANINPGSCLLELGLGLTIDQDIVAPLSKGFIECVDRGDLVDRWLYKDAKLMSDVEWTWKG